MVMEHVSAVGAVMHHHMVVVVVTLESVERVVVLQGSVVGVVAVVRQGGVERVVV